MNAARAHQEPNLVLLRHGASEGNEANRFTGWIDERLTHRGRDESVAAGLRLAATGFVPSVVYTSNLSRAVDTADFVLQTMRLTDVPVVRTTKLDERHYGALQGQSKRQVLAEHGEELVRQWRRSLSVRPPGGESIADVVERLRPVWRAMLDDLTRGERVLVVSHGNTLRALRRLVIDDDSTGIIDIEIETGAYLTFSLPIESHTHRMQSVSL